MNVIVLDSTTKPQEDLEYCVHGQTECYAGCGAWLWLGDKTVQLVASGQVVGLCLSCAQRLIPPDRQTPTGHVDDHRRADGPH